MTTEEVNDFFVYRDQKSGQHVIRVHIRHNPLSVDKNVLNYCPDNDSEVRIPALLFLGGLPDDKQKTKVKDFFLNNYRKQIGCHAFIMRTGGLCCAVCYLNMKNIYSMSEINPISSVYPCFRNTGGPFLMGLLFAKSFTFGSGHRTFGRQLGSVQQGSGGVFDIEEDFLHSYKRYDQTGVYGLKVCDLNEPLTPFPNWHQEMVFAIYVCRGARLIVSDDRCYWSNPQILKKTPPHKRLMDRSLLQEGSLVIYEGCTQLTLGFLSNIIDEGKETVGAYFVDFRKASSFFRPSDRFLGSILSGQNRYVIFLGSTESQHNSICWQLMIRTNHSLAKQLNGKVDGFLLAPDGGRILDIQPWNAGFEQVFWRHRYQRLYRSVLSPEPTLGRLGFGLPPEDITKRILGLSGQELFVEIPLSLWKPPPNYFVFPPEDNDIRKYLGPIFEVSVKRDTWTQLNSLIIYPPPAPPLYPPLWDKEQNKLKYIEYGTKVKFDSFIKVDGMEYPSVKINNEFFVMRKKRTDDCVWESNPMRPSFADTQYSHLSAYEYRLGSDYLIYHKTLIRIGVLGHYYMDGPYAELPSTFAQPGADSPQKFELITQTPVEPVSPTKPDDSPKETTPTRPLTPAKETSPGKSKGNKPKNPLKGAPEKGKPAPLQQQQTQHQKHEKKKGQPKNNRGDKK